jgi:hypothetical protein
MMWNLPDDAVEKLADLPETGMGFQFVSALAGGERKYLLVFNCERAFDLSEVDFSTGREPADILRNGLAVISSLDADVTMFSAPSPRDFRLLETRIRVLGEFKTPSILAVSALAKNEILAEDRTFYRFSAFSPDRRIDPITGSLTNGTYTTTDNDEPHVPSGFAAVGRYALPNRTAASYKYEIRVPSGTKVEFGTVAPAFSQAGGGVEAFFQNGAANLNGAQFPTKIPDD